MGSGKGGADTEYSLESRSNLYMSGEWPDQALITFHPNVVLKPMTCSHVPTYYSETMK